MKYILILTLVSIVLTMPTEFYTEVNKLTHTLKFEIQAGHLVVTHTALSSNNLPTKTTVITQKDLGTVQFNYDHHTKRASFVITQTKKKNEKNPEAPIIFNFIVDNPYKLYICLFQLRTHLKTIQKDVIGWDAFFIIFLKRENFVFEKLYPGLLSIDDNIIPTEEYQPLKIDPRCFSELDKEGVVHPSFYYIYCEISFTYINGVNPVYVKRGYFTMGFFKSIETALGRIVDSQKVLNLQHFNFVDLDTSHLLFTFTQFGIQIKQDELNELACGEFLHKDVKKITFTTLPDNTIEVSVDVPGFRVFKSIATGDDLAKTYHLGVIRLPKTLENVNVDSLYIEIKYTKSVQTQQNLLQKFFSGSEESKIVSGIARLHSKKLVMDGKEYLMNEYHVRFVSGCKTAFQNRSASLAFKMPTECVIRLFKKVDDDEENVFTVYETDQIVNLYDAFIQAHLNKKIS
jgi:hypothetical protein